MNGGTAQSVITESTPLGLALLALTCLILPFAAFLLLNRCRAARLLPLFAGAGTYLISVRLNDLLVGIMFMSAPQNVKVVIASLQVGVFEELGRWLVMRFWLTSYDRAGDAVSYGIGHGGTECLIHAVRHFQTLGRCIEFRSAGLAALLRYQEPEAAERITAQYAAIAEQTLPVSLLGVAGEISAFVFHIALSVMILHAVKYEGRGSYLFRAMFWHIGNNGLYFDLSLINALWLPALGAVIWQSLAVWLTYQRAGKQQFFDEIRDSFFADTG